MTKGRKRSYALQNTRKTRPVAYMRLALLCQGSASCNVPKNFTASASLWPSEASFLWETTWFSTASVNKMAKMYLDQLKLRLPSVALLEDLILREKATDPAHA